MKSRSSIVLLHFSLAASIFGVIRTVSPSCQLSEQKFRHIGERCARRVAHHSAAAGVLEGRKEGLPADPADPRPAPEEVQVVRCEWAECLGCVTPCVNNEPSARMPLHARGRALPQSDCMVKVRGERENL
eukprot:2163077-Rhodomonas_salina.3